MRKSAPLAASGETATRPLHRLTQFRYALVVRSSGISATTDLNTALKTTTEMSFDRGSANATMMWAQLTIQYSIGMSKAGTCIGQAIEREGIMKGTETG